MNAIYKFNEAVSHVNRVHRVGCMARCIDSVSLYFVYGQAAVKRGLRKLKAP